MAVAFDGEAVQSGTGSGVNTLSAANKTTAGSNRVGIACISGYLTAITGVTWNGVAMTAGRNSPNADSHIYYIIAPPTGASTVTVNFSGNITSGAIVAISYNGAHQTSPIGNTGHNSATAVSPITVNVAAATGDMVVDSAVLDAGAGAATVDGSQSQRFNTTVGGTTTSLASDEAGAASVTMSWTYPGNQYWDQVAVQIVQAAAGTTAAPPPFPHTFKRGRRVRSTRRAA